MDNFKWFHFIILLLFFSCKADEPEVDGAFYYQKAYELISTDLIKAEELAKKSVEYANSLQNKEQLGRSYYLLGYLQEKREDYYNALLSYHDAYKTLRLENSELASDALTNIGLIFFKNCSYDKATVFYKESIQQKLRLKNSFSLAETYRHLAQNFRFLEEYDSAIHYNKKVFDLYDLHENDRQIAMVYLELGLSMLGLNDYENALDQFKEAITIAEGKSFRDIIVGRAYNNIGLTYMLQDNWETAKKYFNLAGIIPDGDWSVLVVNNNLGKIYKHEKNYDSAIYYFKSTLAKRSTSTFNLKTDQYIEAQDNLIAIHKGLDQKDSVIFYYQQKDEHMMAFHENQKINQKIYDQYMLLKAFFEIREKEHRQELQAEQKNREKLAMVSVLSVILLTGGAFFYKRKYKITFRDAIHKEQHYKISKKEIIEDLERF